MFIVDLPSCVFTVPWLIPIWWPEFVSPNDTEEAISPASLENNDRQGQGRVVLEEAGRATQVGPV